MTNRLIFFQESDILSFMASSFIDRHIKNFLSIKTNKPLDLSLSQYFRANKSLGAKDRRIMGETIYGMERYKSLIDYFNPKDRLAFYQTLDLEKALNDPNIPEAAKLGLPEYLYNEFCTHFGEAQAKSLGKILNKAAPTTIRANPLKTTRDNLVKIFEGRFSFSCTNAPFGIQFLKREPLFALPEFKDGLFELQDEGSQLLAAQVVAKPGQWVLDYCSGSGGKTLAFAHSMMGKGQIFLHDVRKAALYEARKRLKRAGIQNGQIVLDDTNLSKLKNKCDWVFLDVPCSGSGTIRRNPDHKWKIDATMIKELVAVQRKIVHDAIQYLKPSGKLVYATCSLLPQENQAQVEYILKNFPVKLEKELILLPQDGGMDGFFSATFINRN